MGIIPRRHAATAQFGTSFFARQGATSKLAFITDMVKSWDVVVEP